MVENALRLRLRIQRSGLPETRIVFLFNASNDATVSKFLERVNEIIPLEADDWGLEDYVVELQSPDGTAFECLHFQQISNLLDKDEEVVIRSLSSEDIKKRRIGGRSQISSDGRHLLDGVPFGRPLLKRLRHRPPIHISPRKKRKTSHATYLPSTSLVRFNEQDSQWDNQYSEYDEDFDPNGIDEKDTSDGSDDSDDSDLEHTLGPDELQLLQENSSILAEQNREKRVQTDCDTRSTTSETSTSGSSDSSDSHSADSSENNVSKNSKNSESDSSSSSSSSSSGESDGDGDISGNGSKRTSSEGNVKNGIKSRNEAGSTVNPPQGKACTRRRNARRRAKQAIERAKKPDLLVDIGNREAKELPATLPAKRISTLVSSASSCSSVEDSAAAPETLPGISLQQREQRRLTLDASASRRILFGALGLRDSKKRLVGNTVPKACLESFPSASKTTKDIFANAYGNSQTSSCVNKNHLIQWSERINYRAVECCDANVDLSEPPFPFVQRWGKQASQHGGQTKSRKKRKNKKKCEGVTEQMDDGGEGHSASNQKSMSLSRAETGPNSEFALPQLPVDLSTLPLLLAGEASVGMVITWKRWALSKKTNWQPRIMDTTALILEIMDEGAVIQVGLSQQDRLFEEEDKVYDEETGDRVYDRFEVPADAEEDEEGEHVVDSGVRQVSFSDLIEPRILSYSDRGK